MSAEQTSLMASPEPIQPQVQNEDEKRQIEMIKEKFDPEKYNSIFFTSTIMDMLPAGVTMVPTVIQIPPHELWDKDANKSLTFLKDGMVELSAPAIKRIGMVAGVKLDRHDERFSKMVIPYKPAKMGYNGNQIPAEPEREATMLLIEYRASMLLPDGTVHSEVSGKEEEYAGPHAREKIDTKAKRNAIKALLNIPLTIPKANVSKPFIVLKPVFHRGHSTETDAILDRIEGAKTYAMNQLYPGAKNVPVKALTVNTKFAAESGEQSIEDIMQMMETAPDLAGLEALVGETADIPKTEAQRKTLIQVYTERKTALEAEVKL